MLSVLVKNFNRYLNAQYIAKNNKIISHFTMNLILSTSHEGGYPNHHVPKINLNHRPGGGGGQIVPPIFFSHPESYSFCELKRHAVFENPTITPSE